MYFYELHVRGPHNNITHNITFKLKYQPENRREDDALILICQDVNVKFWDFCPADVFILKSAETRRDARCRPVDRKYVQISLSALTSAKMSLEILALTISAKIQYRASLSIITHLKKDYYE